MKNNNVSNECTADALGAILKELEAETKNQIFNWPVGVDISKLTKQLPKKKSIPVREKVATAVIGLYNRVRYRKVRGEFAKRVNYKASRNKE